MKKLFLLVLLLLSMSFSNAQTYMYYEDIDKLVSEDGMFFEGFFSLEDDSIYLGSVYSVLFYAPESQTLYFCLPDCSEIPVFKVYDFCLDDKSIYENEEQFIIDFENIYYSIIDSKDYFYIMFGWCINGRELVYKGKFYIEEDPD